MADTYTELAHEIPQDVLESTVRKYGRQGAALALIESYILSMEPDQEFSTALEDRINSVEIDENAPVIDYRAESLARNQAEEK